MIVVFICIASVRDALNRLFTQTKFCERLHDWNLFVDEFLSRYLLTFEVLKYPKRRSFIEIPIVLNAVFFHREFTFFINYDRYFHIL